MIPTAGTTANNDPSIGPPKRDQLDPNVSMPSATQTNKWQGVAAVADNTPVMKKSNVSISAHPMDDNIDHLSSAERNEDSNRKNFPPQIHAANKEGKKSSPPIVYDLGKVSSVPPRPSHPNTPKNQTSTDDTFEDNVPVHLHGNDHFNSSKHEHGAPLDIEWGGNTHDGEVTTGTFPDAEDPLPKKGNSPSIGAKLPPKDNKATFDDTSTSHNKKDHHPSPIYDLGASSSTKPSMKISKRAHGLFGRIPVYSQDKKKPATTSRSLSYSGKGDKGRNFVNNREVNKKIHAFETTVESQELKIQESEEAEKICTKNGLHDRADEMMFVKLSDFDALKMKLEELEVSQKEQRAEIEAQKQEIDELKESQRAETGAQKQRIQDLEASREEDQALIEIPHGANNSSTANKMSSNLPSAHGQSFFKRRMSSVFRNYRIVSNSGNDDENGDTLERDTFSLMMISKVWSRSWALGLVTFLFQITLGAMIAFDQISLSTDSSLFSVPFKVKPVVRIGQFLTIILCLSTQSDILTSVQSVLLLGKGSDWDEVIGETGHKSTSLWIIRILVPNLLKFKQGLLVTFVSFVIIVQSDDIIDLLKDFTALMVLSETDNVFFDLAGYGYLGEELMDQVAKVSDIKVPEEPTVATDTNPVSSSPSTRRNRKLHAVFCIRYLVLLCLFGLMLGGWIAIVVNQLSGKYFRERYPKCNFKEAFQLAKKHFGDDTCYGGPLNTLDCEFEGGDCIDFNIAYPLCKGRDDLINVQSSVGNGKCDPLFMIPECDFDGEDCCPPSIFNSPLHGDGQCHGGMFATPGCLFDKGDCNVFNKAYPQCPLVELGEIEGAEDFVVGNGVCDGIYSSVECGWEDDDCDIGQVGQDLIVEGLGTTSPFASVVVGRKWTMGIHFGGKASVYHYNGMQRRWNPLGNLPTRGVEIIVAFAISTNHAGDDRIAITSYPSERDFFSTSSPGQVRVFDYVASNQTWAQVGQNINGEEMFSILVFGIDFTADGSRLVISAPLLGYYPGSPGICIYEWNIEENWWDLVGNVIKGKASGEEFGLYSTHISSDDGNTVIFNSYRHRRDDNTMSRIYRYDQDSQDWVQLGSDIFSPYAGPSAISSDGTRIVVSSNTYIKDAPGEVKVFDEINNSWFQIGTTITSAQSKNGDGFGSALALSSDGNILAISSMDVTCDDCGTGSVQIYVFISSRYRFISVHPRSSRNGNVIVDRDRDRENTRFGMVSMSADGSTLSIMGVNLIDKQGFVRAYDLNQLFYMQCLLIDDLNEVGNTVCNDRYPHNSEQCGFEDGDCPLPSPVEDYPGCMVSYPDKIGNGDCDDLNLPMYNTTECGYDGGDCLPKPVNGYPGCYLLSQNHGWIGNGSCEYWVNTTECGYDGGDCLLKPVEGYPGCLVPTPDKIGNGLCDTWWYDHPSYNTTECGYDGGDCIPEPVEGYPGCLVVYPGRIGNGQCDDMDPYNTAECGYDGGDCLP